MAPMKKAPMKKVMKAMKVKMTKAQLKINSMLKGRKAAEEDVKYSGYTDKERAAAKKAEAAAKKVEAAAKKAMKTMKAEAADKAMKTMKAMKAEPAEKPKQDKKKGQTPDLDSMSLDDKINYYTNLKPKDQNIDDFLNDLNEKDSQRLWQRYAYARKTDDKAAKAMHGLLICCCVVSCCCNH